MGIRLVVVTTAILATFATFGAQAAEPKKGGILHIYHRETPPSLSIHEEATFSVNIPAMGLFNNLVIYDQHKPQNSLDTIKPELADSWSWDATNTKLTFKLHQGVKWHDGQPFTAKDVKCTFGLLQGKGQDKFRKNPRKDLFSNIADVTTNGDFEVTLTLKRPQPSLLAMLASGYTPIYPCHVAPADMRTHPIGTGPFKFVEFKANESIKLTRNPDYWKKGQPYLDRIVVRNIPDSATRTAALEKGEAHYAGMGAIYYSDVRQLEKLPHIGVSTKGYEMSSPIVELYFNTAKKPFDNPKVRQAISYAINRQMVIDNVWFGFGKPATGPLNSNFAASGLYTADVKNYNVPNGMEIANKLLDEAGYPRGANGIRFEIVHDLTPYGEEWRRFGEYVQQVLERLGIKATLRYEDVATWLRRVFTTYDFDLSSNWIQNLADPAIGVDREYHSKSIRPGTVFVNCTRWSSPGAARSGWMRPPA